MIPEKHTSQNLETDNWEKFLSCCRRAPFIELIEAELPQHARSRALARRRNFQVFATLVDLFPQQLLGDLAPRFDQVDIAQHHECLSSWIPPSALRSRTSELVTSAGHAAAVEVIDECMQHVLGELLDVERRRQCHASRGSVLVCILDPVEQVREMIGGKDVQAELAFPRGAKGWGYLSGSTCDGGSLAFGLSDVGQAVDGGPQRRGVDVTVNAGDRRSFVTDDLARDCIAHSGRLEQGCCRMPQAMKT